MNKVLIVGSSRKDGDTIEIVNRIKQYTNWDIIDLNDYQISYYDYKHLNKDDDYISLMKQILEKYETLIFATPVYWYSMSGIMKVFFDRITDVLEIEKDLGRKLRGKQMAVLSCSIGNNLGDLFWLPFSETAKYLGMKYVTNLHAIVGQDNELQITNFIKEIETGVE